jgi:hypothetical protein
MSTTSIKMLFLGNRVQPVRKTDRFIAICDMIVNTMSDPHLSDLQPAMACDGLALHFSYVSEALLHRKHTYGLPRPVTGIVLTFDVQVVFVSHKKHTYRPPRPVTGIAVPFYVQMVLMPHRKQTCDPPRLVTGQLYHFICRWCSYLTRYAPMVPPWTVTEMTLFFICRWCSYLTLNAPFVPPWPGTGISLLFICLWCSYLRDLWGIDFLIFNAEASSPSLLLYYTCPSCAFVLVPQSLHVVIVAIIMCFSWLDIVTFFPLVWTSCSYNVITYLNWPPLQSSRVRFPAKPDFLRSGGSGMGPTQPHEGNWRANWKKK